MTSPHPELPAALREQVDALLKQAGDARRAGDLVNSERFRNEAWALLPEPRIGWNFYGQVVPRNALLFFRDTKQFDKAQRWLEVAREAYGPGRDDMIEFLAATLWFEMGDLDKAWAEFDRHHKAFKTRPFQGHDRKYLDFYLSRKSGR